MSTNDSNTASTEILLRFAVVPEMLAYLSRLDITGRVTFSSREVVNGGGYGDIRIAECNIGRRRKAKVAAKLLRIFFPVDKKRLLEKEVYVWSKMRHGNVLPLLGYAFDTDTGFPMLISEWMENGSAWHYVKKNLNCDLLRLLTGTARGLAYLHKNDFIHSDIKSDNILVTDSGDALICDFGYTRMIDASRSLGNMTTGNGDKGTPQYIAYELIADPTTYSRHSKESDVWAFGMTVYELYTRQRPYSAIGPFQVIPQILRQKLPEFPPYPVDPHSSILTELLRTICERCWTFKPSERSSVYDILDLLEKLQRDQEQRRDVQMNRQLPQPAIDGPTTEELLPPLGSDEWIESYSHAATQGGPNQHNAGQIQPAGPNQAFLPQQTMKLANMTVKQLQQNRNWVPHPNNATNAPPLIYGPSQTEQDQGPHQQTQPSAIQSQQQQAPVPRSGPTPQQHQLLQAFLQNNNQVSPPSSDSAPPSAQSNLGQPVSTLDGQGGQQQPAAMAFPPFPRDKFLSIMREWWRHNGVNPNPRLLAIGNRQIDIHQLHLEVFQYDGVVNVKRYGLWNEIAAKMGWDPTSLSEAGRTQEEVADQLKTVYEQLLESFELTYASAKRKLSFTSQLNQNADPQGGPNQPSAGRGQALSSQQVMQMMKVDMTVEQMRTAGYNEQIIRSIEQNRPTLQGSWRKMQMQRLQAQQQAAHFQQQGPVQNTSQPSQNQLQPRAGLHNSSPFISENGLHIANDLPHPDVSGGSDQPTEISAQQRPRLNAQHLTSQNMGMPDALSNLQRPTSEAIGQANALMEQLKQSISKERIIRPEHFRQLSDVDKANFLSRFEDVWKALVEIATFLPVYLATTKDVPLVKGVLNMVDLCTRQRQFLQSANPMFILDIPSVERLANSVMDIQRRIGLTVRQLEMLGQGDQNLSRSFEQQQNDGAT